MRIVQRIALVIAIIGCINWLTIGLFDFNIVGSIFDDVSETISRIIYVLVGLSGLVCVTYFLTEDRRY